MSTSASHEYLKGAIMTATPEQLQLMLLDGAIRFATRGVEETRRNNLEGMFNNFDRAQRIVLELSYGLRRDANPTLVDQMSQLYNFVYRRLVEANVKRNTSAAEDALRILRHQRETWQLLVDKVRTVPQQAGIPAGSAVSGAGQAPPPAPPTNAYGGKPVAPSRFEPTESLNFEA